MLDISKLTLGEIDKIETLSGQSISSVGEDASPKGKLLAALAFVIKRREQMRNGEPPSFTWNDALDLGFEDAQKLLGMGGDSNEDAESDDEDPTSGE